VYHILLYSRSTGRGSRSLDWQPLTGRLPVNAGLRGVTPGPSEPASVGLGSSPGGRINFYSILLFIINFVFIIYIFYQIFNLY
jgi:hypothetical protein